jgi:hypothetical protein
VRGAAAWCAAIGLMVGSGCGGARDLAWRATLDRQFDAYVRIVLALGQRDPDSLDFYAGPPEWLDRARQEQTPLADVRHAAARLSDELDRDSAAATVEQPRRAFLARQVRAILARIDILMGHRFSFDEESRRLFGVEAGTRDRSAFARARQELDALLPGRGALAPRYAAFERAFIVPRERVPATMRRAIDGCRRVTLEHLTLPANEAVTVEYVHGMPWSAYTRYEGHARSRTQVNLDYALTIDRLLELACHETYPGHHVIDSLLDLPVEPLFSPQALRTEGAATFAVDLAFPGPDRVAFERELLAVAGLPDSDAELYGRVARTVDRLRWVEVDVARRYLDGDLEFVRAARALEEDAVMPETSAEDSLKFFNRFRTYAVAYTVGRDLVDNFVGSRAGTSRWQTYQEWIRP